MSKLKESLDSKDKGTLLLNQAQKELKGAVAHPLVPEFVARSLEPLFSRMFLVNDNEYQEMGMKTSPHNDPITAENEAKHLIRASRGTAFFTPEHPANGRPAIFIKRSYVENNPNAQTYLPGLLAHEIGHALQKPRTIPLKDIPDNTAALQAFKTKERVLAHVNQLRRLWYGEETPVTAEALIIRPQGFATLYEEVSTGRRYFSDNSQVAFEEVRALIIESILTIIMKGAARANGKPPVYQYQQGRTAEAMELALHELGGKHPKTKEALEYIDKRVATAPTLRKGLEAIFQDLYYKWINEFLDNPFADIQQAFIGATIMHMEHHMR